MAIALINQKSLDGEGTRILNAESARERSRRNQDILIFTCTAFFLFAMAEVVGALVSNSLSLLGDAGAMSIDVFTYLCNIYAERLKAEDVEMSRCMRFLLEILIPTISLCCLLVVTGYVTSEAINVIRRPTEKHETVNIYFLYGFSFVNIFVDALSSYMFFRNGEEDVFLSYKTQRRISSYNSLNEEKELESGTVSTEVRKANLNMISAFTHLTGDSMRTSSVIVAALISTIAKIPSDLCDAYAAIIVTITITFIVVPLMREIYKGTMKSFL